MPSSTTGPGGDPGLSSGPLVFWFPSALVVNVSSELRVNWNRTSVFLVTARKTGVEDVRPWRCFLRESVRVLPCGFPAVSFC